MKNLEMLPLAMEQKERIDELAKQYKRFAHIVVEVVSFKENRLIVRAEQKDLVSGKMLSKKELHERVREMFKGEIPSDWKLVISAVDFDRKDIDGVNIEWIKHRMEKLDLKNKHLSNYTGIDKCTISSLLSGDRDLTKWHKVALYYFFKYYEVSGF
jgi:predicted sugar kinase